MSFATQALATEYAVKHAASLENKVYPVPTEIDEEIARLKLATMGVDDRPAHGRAGEVPRVLGRGHLIRSGYVRMLEPERIVRLEHDSVVLLDQRRLPARRSTSSAASAAEVADGDPDDGRARRARDRHRGRVRVSRSRPRTARTSHAADAVLRELTADRGQPRLGARPRCTPNRRPKHARQLHRDEVDRCRADGRAHRRALRARAPGRSRTATQAAWRPEATAARSAR